MGVRRFVSGAVHLIQRFARSWGWGSLLLCISPAAVATVACLPAKVPDYAVRDAPTRDSVMVFLHGLHGDGRATWTASNWFSDNVAWPCLVLADAEQFPATSAYLASYRSVMQGENPSTRQVAKELAGELVKDGVFAHAHITVVAHSMGGLVLARLLTDRGLLNDEQRLRIRLVVFVGTPAEPTEAAAICKDFGINAQCDEMSNGDEMAKLWTAWDQLPKRPPTWCIAEGKDMAWLGIPPWLRIVPTASAHRPCRVSGQTRSANGLDHSAIAKPTSRTDRPHRDLQVAFNACVKPLIRPARLADVEQPLAARMRGWFDQLMRQLATPGADWRLIVSTAVAPGVDRFRMPIHGSATYDISEYDRLPSSIFGAELERVVRPVLMEKQDFEWVRPVDRLAARLPDGATEALVNTLRSRGELAQDDLIVGLPVWSSQPDVLWLLAVRPGPTGFGLLHVLGVPVPFTRCID